MDRRAFLRSVAGAAAAAGLLPRLPNPVQPEVQLFGAPGVTWEVDFGGQPGAAVEFDAAEAARMGCRELGWSEDQIAAAFGELPA